MKTRKFIFKTAMLAVISAVIFTACETTKEATIESIEGTYIGTLTRDDGLKHLSQNNQNNKATAEVQQTENGVIEVRFQGHRLDTTMMFNHYNHHDSVMVCLTGEDFEHMYGHMPGEGHMSGGMMGHMNNGETEWMHHLHDEHQDGDEHFGGFNMQNHTFGYTFNMMEGDKPYQLSFHGKKQ